MTLLELTSAGMSLRDIDEPDLLMHIVMECKLYALQRSARTWVV